MPSRDFPEAEKRLEPYLSEEAAENARRAVAAPPDHADFPSAARRLAPFTQGADDAEAAQRTGVWAPDVPIESADEPFYLLGAELGIPYAVGRGLLAAGARYGGEGLAKFLTGQAGKGLLGRLPSLAASGAGQGAIASGIDKLAGGEGPDLGTSAGLGAGVNAITGGLATPFINRIAPEIAQRAQRYIAQGIPLRTNQIPGASTAATLSGQLKRFPLALLHKFANMSDEGAKKLSRSLMAAMGSDEEQISMAGVKHGQQDILARANAALQQGDQAAYKLAQNQWVNSKILENNPAIWNETTGTVNPSGLYRVINSRAAGYGGVGNASAAALRAGNPADIGTLAEGAKTFAPQVPSVRNLASGVVAGGGLLGFGELEGLPLIETLGHHPEVTGAALGTLGGIGALQNTQPYTNWLLNRSARGAGPLLAGSNPLIPAYLAARGPQAQAPGLAALSPISSAEGAEFAPSDLAPHIASAASRYGLDPAMLTAQLRAESNFKNSPPNKSGAAGVAQFTPDTARQYGIDPMDPVASIDAQGRYMRDLRAKFGNDGLALAAYNWGPGNVSSWLSGKKSSVPSETRDYVKTITGRELDDWASAGGTSSIPRIEVHPAAPAIGMMTIGENNPLSGSQ